MVHQWSSASKSGFTFASTDVKLNEPKLAAFTAMFISLLHCFALYERFAWMPDAVKIGSGEVSFAHVKAFACSFLPSEQLRSCLFLVD